MAVDLNIGLKVSTFGKLSLCSVSLKFSPHVVFIIIGNGEFGSSGKLLVVYLYVICSLVGTEKLFVRLHAPYTCQLILQN